MNKRILYTFSMLFFAAAVLFIFLRFRAKEKADATTFYELQNRKGVLAAAPEWASIQTTASNLFRAVRENPDDKKSALGLAALFIQEARVTGNYMYYDRAAMKQVNNVLAKDENDFQALTFKALLYLSQHHFADGLATASKAQKLNPYNSFIYGLLVDANVEMGDYKAAVENADKMVSIRPDMRSYSRISYLREIHGDYPGAIFAMKAAVDAGMPGDEATEWTRIQLGHLYENSGDMKSAQMQYTLALNERPAYAYALAGLAHVALSKKNYSKAISYLLQADSLVNDYSFKEELVDVYQLTGEDKKADALSALVIKEMTQDATSASNDENIGHYADRELAYAYLKTGNTEKALEHALAEYNRRPKNIDANETVAWVQYKRGTFKEALPYIEEALKTNSKNPTLLCHAGLIYYKAGDSAKAKFLLTEALKNNPNINEALKEESSKALQNL